MFENKTEEQARAEILTAVAQYCEKFHNNNGDFKPGDKINYASRVYDSDEMTALVDSSLDFWLTSGRYTERFEKEFAEYVGVKFCSFVNSGSSANLLAFTALTSPLLSERAVKRGDEVITVAAGFPTTVAPIIQYGAVPVFVDVTVPGYNINPDYLENALSPKTRAVMLAHTLGNPFNIAAVKSFCEKHNLWLIEDNCDSLGSLYTLNGETKKTGTFGDIASSSFYPPHHLTTGEGGAVYTNNPLLNKIVRSLRDWGRDCCCPSGVDNFCTHRFDGQYGQLPVGYDHKYVYSHFGYNMKATDMQAALGCAQLKKFPGFAVKRRANFKRLYETLSDLSDRLVLPCAEKNSDPCWFGFIMTCREGIDRKKIVPFIEAHGVQTRMLFAGNLIRHPCFDTVRGDSSVYRVASTLEKTDTTMNDSFWVGVYPGMTDEKLDYMAEIIHEALK